METLHRSFLLEDLLVRANEDGTPSNIFDLSASSEFPVNRGRYTEILDHGPNSMRSTASSLLFNHNPDYLMGAVRSLASSGKRTSQASVEILPGATLPSGVSALDAVRSGALKGVSIGYRINAHTRSEAKDGTITIRATDWTISEISLTPIPADPTVGLGRSSDPDGVAFAALFDSEQPKKDRAQMADPIIPALAPVAVPITDFRAEAKTIATQAEALGLRSADFVGLPAHEAQTAMLNAVAASRKADPVMKPSAIVTADSDEKMVRHCLDLVKDGEFKRAVNIFNQRNGGQALEGEALVNAVSRGFSPGRDSGLFDMGAVKRSMKAGKWNDQLDADAVRAALVSSSFTMIAGLASAKLAFDGFSSYQPWSDAVIDRMTTGDFKAARTASMQLSDFSSPAEGSAFSDMTVGDAGGTNSLTMRGSGIELTKQAIYNDETGTFLRTIFKVGYMGAQHQDKLVATTVEASVFTAATAANAFSQANMKTSWSNMMAVTGPSGEKPGYIPRKILVPTALYLTAVEATTVVGGSTIASPLAKDVALGNKFALEVVHGLHLSSATNWYMLADNVMNPAWTFLTHSEYPIPQIFEVDSGLVASRKFRVEYPSAVITNHLNPGTNTKPVGAYKNT
jgi:HK97 family phage prohead protease